ncbi:MAG: hypothetical protein ACI89J_004112, partial [Hyphomicrobiaceae bacterium]
ESDHDRPDGLWISGFALRSPFGLTSAEAAEIEHCYTTPWDAIVVRSSYLQVEVEGHSPPGASEYCLAVVGFLCLPFKTPSSEHLGSGSGVLKKCCNSLLLNKI